MSPSPIVDVSLNRWIYCYLWSEKSIVTSANKNKSLQIKVKIVDHSRMGCQAKEKIIAHSRRVSVVISPFHHCSMCCVITSPFHRLTIILFHRYTITPLHHSRMKSHHHLTILLLHHCTIKPPKHCIIDSRVG